MYVNGTNKGAEVAGVALGAQEEIALIYGKSNVTSIPSTYAFPDGL